MSRRRSLEETQKLLLDTGEQMLIDSGVNVTLGAITIIDVCRAAGLTTAGSAYKIWETQEAYRTALLRHLLGGAVPSTESIDVLTDILRTEDADLPNLTELIRTVSAVSARETIGHRSTPVYLALWLAAPHDPILADELYATDRKLLDAYAAMYDALVDRYDLEWVPPYNGQLLAVTLSALVEGLNLRSKATPSLVTDPLVRATGPDGEDQDWHLFATCAETLIESFTRPHKPAG